MLQAISQVVSIPIVASGGAGCKEDFLKLFALPGIDAGLAASIFHFRQLEIGELKKYLHDSNIPVRL